uniref:Uncharacterized protein n=1 Tax=Manihot esculenta TaxID=3983 RepID=A0A2C9VY60_MANES
MKQKNSKRKDRRSDPVPPPMALNARNPCSIHIQDIGASGRHCDLDTSLINVNQSALSFSPIDFTKTRNVAKKKKE